MRREEGQCQKWLPEKRALRQHCSSRLGKREHETFPQSLPGSGCWPGAKEEAPVKAIRQTRFRTWAPWTGSRGFRTCLESSHNSVHVHFHGPGYMDRLTFSNSNAIKVQEPRHSDNNKGSSWCVLKKQRLIKNLSQEKIRENLVSPESNNRIA